jgi:hypothetical protein
MIFILKWQLPPRGSRTAPFPGLGVRSFPWYHLRHKRALPCCPAFSTYTASCAGISPGNTRAPYGIPRGRTCTPPLACVQSPAGLFNKCGQSALTWPFLHVAVVTIVDKSRLAGSHRRSHRIGLALLLDSWTLPLLRWPLFRLPSLCRFLPTGALFLDLAQPLPAAPSPLPLLPRPIGLTPTLLCASHPLPGSKACWRTWANVSCDGDHNSCFLSGFSFNSLQSALMAFPTTARPFIRLLVR